MTIEISTKGVAGEHIAAGIERAGRVAKRGGDLVGRVLGHVDALVTDVRADASMLAAEARGLHRATVLGWIELQLAAMSAAARGAAERLDAAFVAAKKDSRVDRA
jgi:hypothetical protein